MWRSTVTSDLNGTAVGSDRVTRYDSPGILTPYMSTDPVAASVRPPSDRSFAYAVYRIASSFVSLEDIDTIINTALESLGQVCGAGRAYLFLFRDAPAVMDNTHEWCAAGVEPQIEMLQALPLDLFPWWMEKLRAGEMILVPDVGRMTPEATAEREILEEQDVKSVLVLPVYRGSALTGFVGLDNVMTTGTWDPETREYLKVASEMVSSTLSREERRRDLVRRTRDLENAYKDLKNTQERLVQAEKLAGVGLLAAGVAHEINNPVGFLRSNAETMRGYVDGFARLLDRIKSAASREEIESAISELDVEYLLSDAQDILASTVTGLDRIASIVQDLLNLSRSERLHVYDMVDINDSLDAALTLVGPPLLDVAELHFERGEVPEIMGNRTELDHAFYGIITNAVQSIGEHRGEALGIIDIRTWEEAGYICCEICDDGSGFSDDALRHVFEPFYTTREVGKGTGLGMTIAYDSIVTRHGGEIEVTNLSGGGARVMIRIPVKSR